MNRVKVFVDNDPQAIEEQMNFFFAENKDIEVLSISTTEVIADETSWATVYVLYKDGES